MSDYSKTTNFTAKDSLPTGNPSKLIKGSEFDTEFDALETAVGTKANKIGSAVTGDLILQAADGDLSAAGWGFPNVNADITATDEELNILDGATVTTAELNKLDESAQAITGFIYSSIDYIDDVGDSQGGTTYDVDTNLTDSIWTSIGPTGSSADKIWTALDIVPSSASWVEITVVGTVGDSSGSDNTKLYKRITGSSVAIGDENLAFSAGVTGAATLGETYTTTIKIPVDASNRFDLYYDQAGGSAAACVIALVGAGT